MRLNLITLTILILSCNSKKQVNFKLIKIDSLAESRKEIATKYFVDSNDVKRKLSIYFWGNGNIMTKALSYDNMKDGDWEFFSNKGKLRKVMRYKENKLIKTIYYENSSDD
jgi:antitoxin component YwqK of YwqJK toxin-antitoxin module